MAKIMIFWKNDTFNSFINFLSIHFSLARFTFLSDVEKVKLSVEEGVSVLYNTAALSSTATLL